MNTLPTSPEDNGVSGSDSDSNPDDSPDYYQPISTSTVDGGGSEDEDEDEDVGGNYFFQDPIQNFHGLPNGWMENGVSSLDISDGDNEDDEKEEEEATESERAIERAFREDERRRNAPLTADNAVRVMEAMRQISFGGAAPDWAAQVPEDQWIDRLRGLRRPAAAAAAGSAATNN